MSAQSVNPARFNWRLGASLYDVIAGAAGVTQLIAPATNVNGIWLRTASQTQNSAQFNSLYADTAAPASETDTTKRSILRCGSSNFAAMLGEPIFLPAGVGLWQACGASTARSTGTFDIL